MTDLQIGLAFMGGAVVLAVLGYNRWITLRNQPRRSNAGPDAAAGQDGAESDQASPADGRIEPVLDDFGVLSAAGQSVLMAAAQRGQLDPLIDVLVRLTPDHPVSGEAVLAAQPRSRRIGSKPFAVEGLSLDTGNWETPRSGCQYTSLQAGVQLANRAGALNEIEFSEFVGKTQALADQLAAHVELPDMMTEVARARELDQFASDHDAQLAFKIRATRTAWSPGYIVQQAQQAGFVPAAIPGRLALPASDPACGPLALLQFEIRAALDENPEQHALVEFELLFDVPQSPRAENPYVRLREVAQQLAATMEGRLTDERGVPLGNELLDQVTIQLDELYDQLESRDLAAGSPQARRLFS